VSSAGAGDRKGRPTRKASPNPHATPRLFLFSNGRCVFFRLKSKINRRAVPLRYSNKGVKFARTQRDMVMACRRVR